MSAPAKTTAQPELSNAANNMSTSFDNLQNAWENAKKSALEAKRWIELQLEAVEKNDEKLHKIVLGILAIEFLWMGGPWTLAYFAIGYAIEATYSEKIQAAVERIKTVWLKTRTMKFAAFAIGMVLIPSYRWQFAALIFGAYMSHYTTPKKDEDALAKDFVMTPSETAPRSEPQPQYSWYHIKYWPVWPQVFPKWFGAQKDT